MQCFVVHNVLFAFDKLYCFFLISFSSFLLCLSFFRFFFFCFTSELFTPPFFLLLCLVSNLLCLCFIYILFLPCKSLVCFHTHLQTSVQSLCILTVFLPSQIGGYLLTFFLTLSILLFALWGQLLCPAFGSSLLTTHFLSCSFSLSRVWWPGCRPIQVGFPRFYRLPVSCPL